MKIIILFGAIVFCISLTSCSNSTLTCKNSDKECIKKKMRNHVTRKLDYWKKFYQKPINQRVFIAPDDIIDYIDLDNRLNGYLNKPFSPNVSENFLKNIKDAIDEIPSSVKNLLKDNFVGVFLINDLGGTGYTDYILDESGKPVASFVVLDFQVLKKRNANEWATWKESTPFKKNPAYKIEAIIELEETNNRKYAIQYILLHELGHVISVNEFFHPPWTKKPNEVKNLEKYKFFHKSWIVDKKKNKVISKFDSNVLSDRKNVVYYFGAKLDGAKLPSIYYQLEKTNFPTLYAATRPGDDWAESFVSYVHTVMMKKPFIIKIKKNDKVVKEFTLCWGKKRCTSKEKILNELFRK